MTHTKKFGQQQLKPRPKEYGPEVFEHICELVSSGRSLSEVCRHPGLPAASTVWRWLPEAANMMQRAKSKPGVVERHADVTLGPGALVARVDSTSWAICRMHASSGPVMSRCTPSPKLNSQAREFLRDSSI